MYKCHHNFLECYSVLNSLQFGFRQKCLTKHAFISITESIRQSIDRDSDRMREKKTENINYCPAFGG